MMLNAKNPAGGDLENVDGIENLCRRDDETIEYIFI